MRLHLSMRSRKVPLQRVRVGGGGVASGGHFYHHDIPGGGMRAPLTCKLSFNGREAVFTQPGWNPENAPIAR